METAVLGELLKLDNTDEALQDAPDGGPTANLLLLEDYPVPLTEPQRRAFQRHVATQVRKFTLVYRAACTLRRGLRSLRKVTDRLKAERVTLKEALARLAAGLPWESTSSSGALQDEGGNSSALKRARTEGDSAAASPSGSAASEEAPPRRRGGGGLLRSAMFANLQSQLTRVHKEAEGERASAVAINRERITRETRLSILAEDLASHEAVQAPLEERLTKCEAALKEATDATSPLLQLLEEMFSTEAQYAASFSLRACGLEDADCSGSRGAGGPSALNLMLMDGESAACGISTAYEIPFRPALYTPEMEDMIRSQVEEVLDAYVAFRGRIDPVLNQLAEAKQAEQALRVGKLMEVIGIGAGGKDVLDLTLMGPSPSVLPTAGSASSEAEDAAGRQVRLAISESDVDSDAGDAADGDALDAEARDKEDRRLIQTALSALDDFEEIY